MDVFIISNYAFDFDGLTKTCSFCTEGVSYVLRISLQFQVLLVSILTC